MKLDPKNVYLLSLVMQSSTRRWAKLISDFRDALHVQFSLNSYLGQLNAFNFKIQDNIWNPD
jgi:hypothetical protein